MRWQTHDGHPPAINPLFRSIALAYGRRATGVLLSGVLHDGVRGLAAIRSRGGAAIAQSPDDALFPAMPQNVINAGVVDYQAPAAQIGGLLAKLTGGVLEDTAMAPDTRMESENRTAMARQFATDVDSEELGPPSGYVCPDCNGALIVVTAATTPATGGTPGPGTRCSRRATTRSAMRCGSRYATCRRRPSYRAGWPMRPLPAR